MTKIRELAEQLIETIHAIEEISSNDCVYKADNNEVLYNIDEKLAELNKLVNEERLKELTKDFNLLVNQRESMKAHLQETLREVIILKKESLLNIIGQNILSDSSEVTSIDINEDNIDINFINIHGHKETLYPSFIDNEDDLISAIKTILNA